MSGENGFAEDSRLRENDESDCCHPGGSRKATDRVHEYHGGAFDLIPLTPKTYNLTPNYEKRNRKEKRIYYPEDGSYRYGR